MQAVHSLEAAALHKGREENFRGAVNDVEVACTAFIEARKKLNEHIANHGCI